VQAGLYMYIGNCDLWQFSLVYSSTDKSALLVQQLVTKNLHVHVFM